MHTKMTIAAALLLLAACSDGVSPVAGSADKGGEVMMSAPASAPLAPPTATRESFAALEQAPPPAPMDRKIIRTANLRIQLDDVPRAAKQADSIAQALNGMVASSHIAQGDHGEMQGQVTIRVPNDRFAEALAALRTLGRVRLDNTSSDDVTRAYNDLEIRLAVKRDMVTRLRALLANRTARLADVIEVERELGRAIAELEQMEGERRYMDQQIAMSTIDATFFRAPIAGRTSFGDPIAVALRRAVALLGVSVGFVISAIVFLTPWAVLLAVAWRVVRALRRRLRPVTPAAEPSIT